MLVVETLAWPSQRPIVTMSTPAYRKWEAAVRLFRAQNNEQKSSRDLGDLACVRGETHSTKSLVDAERPIEFPHRHTESHARRPEKLGGLDPTVEIESARPVDGTHHTLVKNRVLAGEGEVEDDTRHGRKVIVAGHSRPCSGS